jgi:hypothetical protein
MNETLRATVLLMGKHYKKLDDINSSIEYIKKIKTICKLSGFNYDEELNKLLKDKEDIENHIEECLKVLKSA